MRYLETSAQVSPQFKNPPGYMSAEVTARTFRARVMGITTGKSGNVVDAYSPDTRIEDLIDARIVFAGTPEEVYQQIIDFDKAVGGFGNLLMMGHAANLSHEDTVDNITLFGTEVLPKLKNYTEEMTMLGTARPDQDTEARLSLAETGT